MRKIIRLVETASIAIHRDNPGGTWLTNKQRTVERMAAEPGASGATRYMVFGVPTAWISRAYMSTNLLAQLPGAADEDRRPGDVKFDSLLATVEEQGWNQEWPVMLRINHKGRAYIFEGNTRLAVARHLNIPDVLVSIEWMNGAEEVEGSIWSPERVMALIDSKPR